MLSNLIDGEADIAVADITLCCRRTEVVDYLWTISQPRETFVIKGWHVQGAP